MDVATKIQIKLKKILKRLKGLGIIKTYKLEINFFPIKRNLIKSLIDIDSVLKKCLKKIIIKPRKAEIRNVITELVRKKNLHDFISEEKVKAKNVCYKKYTNKDHTNISCEFQCEICNKIFNSRKNFIAHKKLHDSYATYLCEKCGVIFHTKKKWQEHIKENGKKVRLCCSIKCFKSSQRNDDLSKEEALETSSAPLKDTSTCHYSCKSICANKKEINSVQSISIENNLSKSTQEKKFTCTCGKVFRIWKSLKKHEKLKHSSTNAKYNCPNCEKCFKEKGKLNRHMLSHKESQYSCSVCSKLFTRSDTLKRHLSICHYISKEFYCHFCEKKFKLKYNRDIHEENLHKNFNSWIQCERCGKKFKNKITFKSHQKSHFKSRITCTVCFKSFLRKSYYDNHMKSKHFPHRKPSTTDCMRIS